MITSFRRTQIMLFISWYESHPNILHFQISGFDSKIMPREFKFLKTEINCFPFSKKERRSPLHYEQRQLPYSLPLLSSIKLTTQECRKKKTNNEASSSSPPPPPALSEKKYAISEIQIIRVLKRFKLEMSKEITCDYRRRLGIT